MNDFDRHMAARSQIGEYERIRPLARGGMAELFLVRSVGPEGFEKVVVLKRVLPHLAENKRFVRAFLEEAKLVAGLEHPNIAPVYDMGSVDGSYYFTMEYVRGVDVRTILKRCKRDAAYLPIEHAVYIARDIASALHYAHERRAADGHPLSLVHRDVSPSNIIVSFEGAPKLIDFGIAKATSSTEKTQTGTLKGKVAYMSPEQARGAAIDRRSDVFSLGVVLWEMLAGKRLFKCDNDLATLQRVIYETAPRLSDARSDCPEPLVEIVARALANDPSARYQTAQQLQLDLEDFAVEHKLKLSTIALGAYLREHFAVELRDAADDAAAATATALTAPSPDSDPDSDPDELEAFERPTVVPLSAAEPIVAPTRRARWPWLAAAIVAGVAAVVLGVAMRGNDAAAPTSVGESHPVPPPAPPALAPAPPPPAEPPHEEPNVVRAVTPLTADSSPEPVARTTSPVRAKHPRKVAKQQPPTQPAVPAPAETQPTKSTGPFDPNSVFPP